MKCVNCMCTRRREEVSKVFACAHGEAFVVEIDDRP
jgi:hypothetical protein